MTKNLEPQEPQNAEDQHLVTFANYKPDTSDNAIAVFNSTYKEAQEWGAIPVSDDELKENLGLTGGLDNE